MGMRWGGDRTAKFKPSTTVTRPTFTAPNPGDVCQTCQTWRSNHIDLRYCPEWALREAWGK